VEQPRGCAVRVVPRIGDVLADVLELAVVDLGLTDDERATFLARVARELEAREGSWLDHAPDHVSGPLEWSRPA
jgi:hypothetical protein